MRLIAFLSLLSSLSLSLADTPASAEGALEQTGVKPPAHVREELQARSFVGTWSLSDEKNDVFDVVLHEDGSARSNWAKGSHGAEGEGGRWRLYGQGVRIDYDDGWVDIIRMAPTGFEQLSYSPDTPLTGPWSNHGKAVRLGAPLVEWVGVYQLTRVGNGKPYAVALQSDGQAFKAIDEDTRGLWSQQGDSVRIHWVDGWYDEIHRATDGSLEQRSWEPGQSRSGPPGAKSGATRR